MKLIKNKRGISRSIDFLLSFILFMVFVGSMLFITYSINVDLFATPVSRPSETADAIARRMFSLEGLDTLSNSNWGTYFQPLTSFGLSDGWHSYYRLDPNKIARINPLLQNTGSVFLSNVILSYDTIHSFLDLDSTEIFSLRFEMLLKVQISLAVVSNTLRINAVVTNQDDYSPTIAIVHFYALSLTSRTFFSSGSTSVQTNGQATWFFNPSSQNNYLFFAVAQLGAGCGVSNFIFSTSSGTTPTTIPTQVPALLLQNRIAYYSTADDPTRVVYVGYPFNDSFSAFTSSFDSGTNTVNVIPSQSLPLNFLFSVIYEPQNNVFAWECFPTIFNENELAPPSYPALEPLSRTSDLISCGNCVLRAEVKYWRF
ncbi:MAG: hypothetical protein ACFFC7_04305 [Candidatus Hermodarchaeota archaeon]